ncbi:hypothetical protein [Staphylococcus epidermidis]|uniref:hypothetical protein n=1 Tax=Staphylococcus epidermidis TaxID=1282 RepID=UPI00029949DC|nr:hypothetical protein [Staphylococcus epidermidis]EKS24326.1 hypothetical protein HMPREF9281_02426 [Staphylococcus epidermidis BVS058A4]MDR6745619.1 hypothetical protein [Staphylococcus epidermidis]MDV8169485.1 hypothetical protein [Streptococcus pneumoniae]
MFSENNVIKQADINNNHISNHGVSVEQNESNNVGIPLHNHKNNSSDSHNMPSSNTININEQYISASDLLKTESELLREQIRYYKKYIKQYLSDFIDEEKRLKNNYYSISHLNKTITKVCNYLFISIKGAFTQRHEEDYNRGVITKSPEMALFGDLQHVMTAQIKSIKVDRLN